MPFEFLVYKTHAAVNRWFDDGAPMPDPLVIPDEYDGKPVTEVRSGSFAGNMNLKHIIFPKSLKTIGASAFKDCRNLMTVNYQPGTVISCLPESLETIEEKAFYNSGIKRMLMIYGKYLHIGDSAFEKCSNLTRIGFHSEELTLGKGCFRSCDALETVLGPSKIDTLPEECFARCPTLKIMALSFREASERCFYEDSRLEMIKPIQKLKICGKDAFWGCQSLEGIPAKWKGVTKKPKAPAENVTAEAEKPPQPMADIFLPWKPEPDAIPLLKLDIRHIDPLPRIAPPRLKGVFRNLFGQKFKVNAPASMASMELSWTDAGKLVDILDYLSAENIEISLYGTVADGHYEVYDMEPDVKSGPLTSKAFFRELVRRTLESPVHKAEKNKEQYYLHTKEEFQFFLDTCGETLPLWVQEAAKKELSTINQSFPNSDSKSHAQLALEILLNVDWNPPANLYIPSIDEAQKVLDQEFYGLHTVKEAFYDLLAQMTRTGELAEEYLLLVGPPGVGKTYLINAMAKILQLPVVSLDFSGIGKAQDEIMGSNRIYSNARPGTFLEGCFTHRTSTVLLFLNEVDKASERSVSDTLLPLLDGAGVKEGFLEQVIPTKGHILCFASANDINKISPPLRSRFRIVNLDPYTPQDKLKIWRNHALPEAMEKANVSSEELQFTAEAEEVLIKEYGTEPGVRDIYAFARDFVRRYCREAVTDPGKGCHTYTPEEVKAALGPSRQIHRPFNVHAGSVRFAYMSQGRAVLSVLEVALEKGTGKLEILGAVPPTQKHYTRIAWKAVKQTTFYDLSNTDITVFFPTPIVGENLENIVGLPVYLGICSALIHTPLNLADTVIYGSGIDLFGNIYLDCTQPITPLIHSMDDHHIQVVYGPTGLSSRIDFSKCENTPVILESHEGEAMIRMVIANTQNRST